MKVWKISFFIMLSMFVVSNVFWINSAIDAGVSYTYQQVTLEEEHQKVNVLGDLIVKHGQNYSPKDILHILRQYKYDAFIVEGDDYIDFNGIKFYFTADKLVKVE